jgi:chromosome segregation ATPase
MDKKGKPSELISAAEALDAELQKFEQLSETIQKTPFNSEKNLARASRTLTEIAQVGEALQTHLGSLVAAIGNFRQKQETQADAVQKRAQELQERGQVLEGLLAEYRALGENARQLNLHLLSLKSSEDEVQSSQFLDLDSRVTELAQAAQNLFDRAESQGFADIAHQADALRQQLQTVRNKLNLLRQRLPQA